MVIDASAAYDLLTEEKLAEKLSKIESLVAPDIIVAELLNARWKVARAKQAAPSFPRTLEFLERIRIEPTLPLAGVAALLSEKLDHPAYDCFYIALAQRENAKLLTADERLIRKMRANGLSKLLR